MRIRNLLIMLIFLFISGINAHALSDGWDIDASRGILSSYVNAVDVEIYPKPVTHSAAFFLDKSSGLCFGLFDSTTLSGEIKKGAGNESTYTACYQREIASVRFNISLAYLDLNEPFAGSSVQDLIKIGGTASKKFILGDNTFSTALAVENLRRPFTEGPANDDFRVFGDFIYGTPLSDTVRLTAGFRLVYNNKPREKAGIVQTLVAGTWKFDETWSLELGMRFISPFTNTIDREPRTIGWAIIRGHWNTYPKKVR